VVAADAGIPLLTAALRRVRATPQQVGLSRSARAVNVQAAFAITPVGKAAIHGKRLVLVDDVLTSGATVDACTRVLQRAGARNVDVLVFARVVATAQVPI
jgi:predicted amidophosphoribosyltransferase